MKAYAKRILLPALVVAALGAGVAHGKECKGVNFPDQTQVEGANLTLNGLGLRQATAFKVNVYVAALYVAKTSNDANALLGANAPSELILQFVRNVGADVRQSAGPVGDSDELCSVVDDLAADAIRHLRPEFADYRDGLDQVIRTWGS